MGRFVGSLDGQMVAGNDNAGGMDRDLIVRAQAGDQHAFDALALVDYPRLFRVALGILRDRAHAEDATQQAYIDIWRNLRRLRDPAKFEGWSYRLLVHACCAESKRTPKWLPDSSAIAEREPRTTDVYRGVLDRDELEHGFRQLSVDHRVVLVLHYLLDMTLEQVADTLGIAKGSANSRLSRALDSMHKAMGVGAITDPSAEPRGEASP